MHLRNAAARPLALWAALGLLTAMSCAEAGGNGDCEHPDTADGSQPDASQPDAGKPDATPLDTGPEPDGAQPDTAQDVPAPLPDTAADTTGAVVVFVAMIGPGEIGSGTKEDPYGDLQQAIDAAPDGATVHIGEGTYTATPADYADPGCGNCPDLTFFDGAQATRGFLVSGKSLHFEGAGSDKTILVTGAGYGLLFVDAGSSSVRDLLVTGGIRDGDGRATDAGIVVLDTTLLVEDASVSGNDDLYTGPLEDPVVGVGGIFGREGSQLTIRNTVVEDNSWDGITLYRGRPGEPDSGPVALVEGCRIGCTSGCVDKRGRGAGIGVTWDASMVATGNVIYGYWKGIGSFGTSHVELYNNVVRDQVGWGIIASGESTMLAYNNVAARNGTTGIAAWNWGVSGSFVNNIAYANGQNEEWVGMNTGFWLNAFPPHFFVTYNLSFGNDPQQACTNGSPGNYDCDSVPFDGVDGNLVLDPKFADAFTFHLLPDSPAIDAGDPAILDLDGTTSDMGLHGGPYAPLKLP